MFDVVVLGGGPAGTAAALTLLHHSSLSVAVVERSEYGEPRIGETLSPGVHGLLSYLRVAESFAAGGHRPALSTSAAWGGSTVQTRDFLFTPFGKGWHLDRRGFDAMLAEAVQKAGGTLWCNARLVDHQRAPTGPWRLGIERDGEPMEVGARFVVDATGRAATLAKRLGVKRRMTDRLVALTEIFHFQRAVPDDTFTLIETCQTGWWYSARLPGDSMIVAFMTDTDIAQRERLQRPAAWLAALAETGHTGARLRGGHPAGTLRTHAAQSACLAQIFGDGWVAAGDAAVSCDPLSSSGIPRALDSGIRAARGVYGALVQGQTATLQSYAAGLAASFAQYLSTKAQYYKLEERWPDAPFWRRRRENVTLDPQALLRSREEEITSDRKMVTNLTDPENRLLRELCTHPTAAHEVVNAFHRVSGRLLPDERVILALQEMLEHGALAAV
jgi:flavin-dependent dehydrogenase